MSKINLFGVAPPQIPEVDNKLQEDSYYSPEQLHLNATNNSNLASNHHQSLSNSSKLNQFSQQMSASFFMNQHKNSHFATSEVRSKQLSQANTNNLSADINFEEDVKNYFNDCSQKIGIFSQFQKRLASQVTYKIKVQIKRGRLNISSSAINLNFRPKEDKKSQTELKRQLQIKKEEAIQKIKEIEEERLSLIVNSRKKSHRSTELKKDILTEQQRQRLAQLLREKKQFQEALSRRHEKLLEQAKLRKMKDQKERQQHFMAQNEKKKLKILQSLKQLQLRSQERQQMLKKSELREKRSYTHRRYQQKWKEYQKMQELQEKQILQSIHNKFKFSIEEINQHYRNYSLLMRQRESSFKQKQELEQSRIAQSLPKRQKTNFDRIVEEELLLAKQQNQKQRSKAKEHQFKQKIQQYQELLDKKYKPRLDTSHSFILPIPRTYSSVTLTKEERVEKGLEYLAIAKELKKTEQQLQRPPQPSPQVGYSAYKDYLKERQPAKFSQYKKQFSEVIKRSRQSYEDLESAKYLAEGLEAKLKRNPDSKLYQSMKNKLLLLDSLY